MSVKMSPEEAAQFQTVLRKADDKAAKHVQKVENIEPLAAAEGKPVNTWREALNYAREKGYIQFKYKNKTYSTQFAGTGPDGPAETPVENLGTMLAQAEKQTGPETVGLTGGGEMGAMAETRNVSRDELDQLIIEEWTHIRLEKRLMKISKHTLKNLVVEELSRLKPRKLNEQRGSWRARYRAKLAKKYKCGDVKSPPYRMRRASWKRFKTQYGLKKGQWPAGDAFPAYAVKGADGKIDGPATYAKFYAEVRKNKCAYIALGGMRRKMPADGRYPFDYKFGDQHSDAYTVLNPQTRAGGGTEISPETATQLDPRGAHKAGYEEAVKKLKKYEAYCQKEVNDCDEEDHNKMEKLRKQVEQLRGVEGGSQISPDNKMRIFSDRTAYSIASYEKYSRLGEKYKRRVEETLAKLQKLEAEMKKLDDQGKALRAEPYPGGARAPRGPGRTEWLAKRKEWRAQQGGKQRAQLERFEAASKEAEALAAKLRKMRGIQSSAGGIAQTHAASAKQSEEAKALYKKVEELRKTVMMVWRASRAGGDNERAKELEKQLTQVRQVHGDYRENENNSFFIEQAKKLLADPRFRPEASDAGVSERQKIIKQIKALRQLIKSDVGSSDPAIRKRYVSQIRGLQAKLKRTR